MLEGLLGLAPGQRPLQASDGPVMEVRPGGDCRQAQFSGLPAQLGLRYEDVVEVWWSEDLGATWKARWAGYVDTLASRRDAEPGQITLLGLRQRLDRVEARRPVVADTPARQWAQLINDCLDSGQLGVSIRRAAVPDAGADEVRPRILPRYESVMMIADKWLVADPDNRAGAPPGDYGVNAQREPIWGAPRGVHTFDERDGAQISGKPGSSAALCTHIRATWTTPSRGPYVVNGVARGPDGQLVYFDDYSILAEQEGAQATFLVTVADATVYGYSSRRELLPPLPQYFTRSVCSGVSARWTQGSGYLPSRSAGLSITVDPPKYDAVVAGDLAALSDGSLQTYVNVGIATLVQLAVGTQLTTGGTFLIDLTYPPGPVPWGIVVHVTGGSIVSCVFDDVLDVHSPPDRDGLLIFPDEVRAWIAEWWSETTPSKVTLRVARTGLSDVQVTTFGALYLDEVQVARAVSRFARVPVEDPETVRVMGWDTEPLAAAVCVYRNPDGSEAERTPARRVDLYRYVIDEDGQQWTEVSIGQADEADEEALAAQRIRQTQTIAVQAAISR